MISRQRDKDTPKIPDLDTPAPLETAPTIEIYWMRWILLAFGWANLGLGIVGGVIPGLPTTVFLLIASHIYGYEQGGS